ncbi:hypothetical protein DFJ73DRAFT_592122 [Zopfochytrium polystomum]|nr:hypothetical protein DFJ73DRAFT_592122 [Zopfochytrium polystomum]
MEEGESGQRHIREHGGTYKTEFYASEPAVLWPTAGSNKLSTLTSSLPFTLSLPVFQVPPSLEVPGIGGGNIEWKVVATLTLGKVAAIVSEKDVTGKAGASQQSSSVKANILSSSTLSSPAQNYVTTERVFIIRRPITTQTEPELGLFNGTSPHGELTYEVLLSTPIVIGPLNWKLWEASITVFPNALCIGRVRNVKCGLVTMVDFIPDSSEFLNPLTKTKALSAFLNAPAASESTLALFDAAASSPTASPDLPPSLSKFLSRFHKKDETYTPASPEIYEVDRAQERLKKEFSFGVPVSENLVPSVDVKNLKIYHKIRFTIEYITVENPFVQDVDTEEDVFADPPVETGKGEKKPAKKYKRRAVIDIPVLLIQGRVGETTVLGRLSI